ncbi:MAG: tRNA (5-methylaminomethyl-2-thiouridine)(34)-methyltransferase MnmD [Saprospiraceae bacterium]|nr:tRNA (5-methylaminomethyl-2-thiouridine)(34)-methyltransferase MnmD [Saprospiraceae bacterium]
MKKINHPEFQLRVTNDSSPTLFSTRYLSDYHSKYGAVQESMHVFLEAGLQFVFKNTQIDPLVIVEMGFGTGLNAMLSMVEAEKYQRSVQYYAIEKYPISKEVAAQLEYNDHIPSDFAKKYLELHTSPWSQLSPLTPHFQLFKWKGDLSEYQSPEKIDLIYFDAFGPSIQPELWTTESLNALIEHLNPGGVFVTYSAKGAVRRSLQSLELVVERLPGPPGKREMLRAQKPY